MAETYNTEEKIVTNAEIVEFFKQHKNKDTNAVVELYKQMFVSSSNSDEGASAGPHDLSIYSKIKAVYSKAVYKL